MKSTLFLLCASFLCTYALAQPTFEVDHRCAPKLDSVLTSYGGQVVIIPKKKEAHLSYSRGEKQTLDSILRVDYDLQGNETNRQMFIYAYDAQSRVKEEVKKQLNGTTYELTSKNAYTYDANGNLTEYVEYSYDSSQWVNSYRLLHEYDNLNRRISTTPAIWVNNTWTGGNLGVGSKSTWKYDSAGRVYETILYSWNATDWEFSFKHTYTFHSSGTLTYLFAEQWESNQWKNYSRINYQLDASFFQISSLNEQWLNNQWQNQNKANYTNDANGRLTESIAFSWYNNQWKLWSKQTLAYDTLDNQIETERSTWNSNTSDWDPFSDFTSEYDAMGNLIERDGRWSWNGNNWNSGERYSYMFDTNVDSNDITDPYWLHGSMWDFQTLEQLSNGTWYTIRDFEYYYSPLDLPTGLSQTNELNLSIYPNPANDLFRVIGLLKDAAYEISIYNMTGNLVWGDGSNKTGIIDVSSLSDGVYILDIRSEQVHTTSKLIVRKN